MRGGKPLALIPAAAIALTLGLEVVLTAPDTAVSWSVLGGGGGGTAASTGHALGATAGQLAAGPAASTSYDLGAGYWSAARDQDADGLRYFLDPCDGDPDCDGDSLGCRSSPCTGVSVEGSACPLASAGPFLRDCIEVFLRTDPVDACPDDASDDAWPPDANRGGVSLRRVDGFDVFLWAQRFGSTTSSTPGGKQPYSARYDLNADGAISGSDIYILAQYFNQVCV